jgi:RNA polymerase sigma factor (sigma-70 family)
MGGREAFEELVRRYQGFVASIAYNATGDLVLSEDIAQQVFITAWQRQGDLRDPARVAAWLAGIARNLVRRDSRNRRREAAARTNLALESPARQVTPAEQAIKQEEQRLLWSILEQIPSNYREPLILYYREQHSVADVASLLRLSEDAVKQRLARGRKMIRQEVARFVEEALVKTRPGARFTATVLAALPSAGKATSAVAGAGGVVAKIVSALSPATIGSLLGSLGGLEGWGFGLWAGLRLATSRQERRDIWLGAFLFLALVTVQLGTMGIVMTWYPWLWQSAWFLVPFWGLYVALLLGLILFFARRASRIKLKHGTPQEKRELSHWGMLGLADGFFWGIQNPYGDAVKDAAQQRARRQVLLVLSILNGLTVIASLLAQYWVFAIWDCCSFPIVAVVFLGLGFRWVVSMTVASEIGLFLVILALMVQDWVAAGWLAGVGVLSAVLFWQAAGTCRNPRSQLKLWILVQWFLALVAAVTAVLRGESWAVRLMPDMPASAAPLEAWVTAGSIIALCVVITLGQWLSTLKPNRKTEDDRRA